MKIVTYRKNGHIGVGIVSANLQTVAPLALVCQKP
jgi:hypothetical protein